MVTETPDSCKIRLISEKFAVLLIPKTPAKFKLKKVVSEFESIGMKVSPPLMVAEHSKHTPEMVPVVGPVRLAERPKELFQALEV